MSPAEQRFWMLAQRRAAGLQPDLHRAILRAFQIIRDSLSEADLERLVTSGQLERVLTDVLSDAVMDRAFLPVRDRIRQTTQAGFRYAVPSLPHGGKVDGVLAVMFDQLNPHVVVAITTLETRVITSLQADIREAVRTIVRANLEAGHSASVSARQIRPIIGMSPTQVENSLKYEAKLREQGMADAQVEKAVSAYRKKAVALNAETNAGTATKDAYKRGQQLAWQDAVDKGIVDGARLKKQWLGIMDNRERPTHVAMEKETVPYDQPYSNGQMVPGDTEYNCRCISRFFVAAA